jgi:hypothetical protein
MAAISSEQQKVYNIAARLTAALDEPLEPWKMTKWRSQIRAELVGAIIYTIHLRDFNLVL